MSLCEYCSQFGLENSPTAGETLWVGTTKDVERRSEYCNFCLLIIQASFWDNDRGPDTLVWLQPTDDGYEIDRTGCFLVPMLNRDDIPPNPRGSGRIVSGKLPPSTIKHWLKLCQYGGHGADAHTECEQSQLWTTIDGNDYPTGGAKDLKLLRLFNVNTMMIEEYPPPTEPPHYVALSYVQGGVKKPNMTQSDINHWETHEMIQGYMSQTHWSTVQLVRDLNITTLQHVWIDELCLWGEGVKDTTNAVDHMDRIYAAADFTIIAADGKDANGGITATTTHRHKVADQMRTKILPGVEWGVVRTVNNHLIENNVYSTRGWTYQEITLSHRCLVFADGMAFWYCRERMFSEDTFLDEFPSDPIPDGIQAKPLDSLMKWIPEDIDDPVSAYAERLAAFTDRDVSSPEDLRHAFRGVLNRLLAKTQSSAAIYTRIYSMPAAFFDISLIWWHRPDRNVYQKVERNRIYPSWSWIGWKGGRKLQFTPGDDGDANLDYLSNDAQNTYYWWKNNNGNDLYPVWSKAAEDNSLLVASENSRIIIDETPKPPGLWTGTPNAGLLQFKGKFLTGGPIQFKRRTYGYGIVEILDVNGYVAGMAYADDQWGDNSLSSQYRLIKLSKAKGCPAFDSGGKLWMNINGEKENKTSNKFYIDLPISADRELRWVMLVKPAGFGGSRVYERVGLGWIDQNKLNMFTTSPRTGIVLA